MTIRLRHALAALALAATLSLGASACGDDEKSGDEQDANLFDTSPLPDTGLPPTDTFTPPQDTIVAPDTQPPQDTGPTQDLIPDLEPPIIISSSPQDGESNVQLPLTVTLTFSEPLFAPSVNTNSVKLIDFTGAEVPPAAGSPSLSADGLTVTWRPMANDQQLASPYTVRIVGGTSAIRDLAGKNIVNDINIEFATANLPNQEGYRAIAAQYAPTLYSSVTANELPQAQVPTKVDADGDWDVSNARDWVVGTATSLIPTVYFDVSETYTHYFIHYMLYFPYVNHSEASIAHANGVSGYLVTVEKARGDQAQRPIAVHAYFREGQNEESYGFATTESGIRADGDSASFWFLEETYDSGHAVSRWPVFRLDQWAGPPDLPLELRTRWLSAQVRPQRRHSGRG